MRPSSPGACILPGLLAGCHIVSRHSNGEYCDVLLVNTNDHQSLVGNRIDEILTADLDRTDGIGDGGEERREQGNGSEKLAHGQNGRVSGVTLGRIFIAWEVRRTGAMGGNYAYARTTVVYTVC